MSGFVEYVQNVLVYVLLMGNGGFDAVVDDGWRKRRDGRGRWMFAPKTHCLVWSQLGEGGQMGRETTSKSSCKRAGRSNSFRDLHCRGREAERLTGGKAAGSGHKRGAICLVRKQRRRHNRYLWLPPAGTSCIISDLILHLEILGIHF
jgi:hypothetical protein